MSDESLKALMTQAEVADLFRVSAVTVGKWADDGLLPHFKTPGGRRRFRRADVEAFLKTEPAA